MLQKFEWLERRNLLSSVSFVQHDLPKIDGNIAAIHVLDVDGDGDQDGVGLKTELSGDGGSFDVLVIENIGGGRLHHKVWKLENPTFQGKAWWGDYDADGDADLFTAEGDFYENTGDDLRLHESFGALGEFWTGDAEWADLDGDGDLDLLGLGGIALQESEVWWSENLDGKGDFGGRERLASAIENRTSVGLADIDGDGTLDVWAIAPPLCSELNGEPELFWLPGLGAGVFGIPQMEAYSGRFSLCGTISSSLGDVDQDDDLDILLSGTGDHGFWWLENDGGGTFGVPENTQGGGRGSLVDDSLVDVDLDGDLDVLGAASSSFDAGGGCNCMLWYEVDAGSLPEEGHQIGPLKSPTYGLGDLDSDGDIDIVGADWWYENKVVNPASDMRGDLDLDGIVAFSDFLILSANFGRDDQEVRLPDGDIDGNGKVEFSDFLMLAASFGKTV